MKAMAEMTAEDLPVMKVFAGCPRDWLDVETVWTRQGTRLVGPHVMRELERLRRKTLDLA